MKSDSTIRDQKFSKSFTFGDVFDRAAAYKPKKITKEFYLETRNPFMQEVYDEYYKESRRYRKDILAEYHKKPWEGDGVCFTRWISLYHLSILLDLAEEEELRSFSKEEKEAGQKIINWLRANIEQSKTTRYFDIDTYLSEDPEENKVKWILNLPNPLDSENNYKTDTKGYPLTQDRVYMATPHYLHQGRYVSPEEIDEYREFSNDREAKCVEYLNEIRGKDKNKK